jgi:hypothetical protein
MFLRHRLCPDLFQNPQARLAGDSVLARAGSGARTTLELGRRIAKVPHGPFQGARRGRAISRAVLEPSGSACLPGPRGSG